MILFPYTDEIITNSRGDMIYINHIIINFIIVLIIDYISVMPHHQIVSFKMTTDVTVTLNSSEILNVNNKIIIKLI